MNSLMGFLICSFFLLINYANFSYKYNFWSVFLSYNIYIYIYVKGYYIIIMLFLIESFIDFFFLFWEK